MRHCIHGADADLIMLGLVTHEPHFYILRESVMDKNSVPSCFICGQVCIFFFLFSLVKISFDTNLF
jgi:5'-3' exoribonuclease 2